MEDTRRIVRAVVLSVVGNLSGIGHETLASPDLETVRLGTLFPMQSQLDVFISKLGDALVEWDASDVLEALKRLTPENTVGDVIQMIVTLSASMPRKGTVKIRFGSHHDNSVAGVSIESIRTGKVVVAGSITGNINMGDSVAVGRNIVVGGVNNHTSLRIFYATDRKETRGPNSSAKYGAKRSNEGRLNYGECTVSIPKIHKVGKLESPSILRLEFRPDPKKHIILEKVQTLEEQVFFKNVSWSVSRAPAKDAFVFVHGYNVSFEDAARRTGQIAFDLHFVGAPILYSWPSNGKFADYIKDETNITWASPHFERFLDLLARYSGATRIHIIAHSMGNRAVCEALAHIAERPDGQLRFNHLVLAAPDIDADTFRELAESLKRLSGRITLYESSKDKAIRASKKIHGSPRAGEPILVIPGLDTIDASAINTDFLSHSYFSDNWPLLSDIYSILASDKAPADRFGLAEMTDTQGRYYAFRSA
jgi:esterase/lipase superfamily enzyme